VNAPLLYTSDPDRLLGVAAEDLCWTRLEVPAASAVDAYCSQLCAGQAAIRAAAAPANDYDDAPSALVTAAVR
jgi:hypothetical protein